MRCDWFAGEASMRTETERRPTWPSRLWRLGLLLAGLACGPPPTPPDLATTVESGVPAMALDPTLLRSAPGLSEARWNVSAGGVRSARVWMTKARRPRTVVIVLHGAIPHEPRRREGQSQMATQHLINCLVAPALMDLDPVIIAPHSIDGQWWKRADTEFVLGLARAAQQRWPEAGRRRVIMGYSNGGIGTWYFARLYPEYFAAAIPMAFNDTIVGVTPLPVYAIQGEKDELFAIRPVRSAVAAARAAGVDVTLDERNRAGHMNACAYAPELARAARWLEQHAFPKALGVAEKADVNGGER
jgi:dienelactone hydrolase